MQTTLFALFILLHGLVHILYFGQNQRYFELRRGMTWPDQSWLLSRSLKVRSVRLVCSSLCLLSAAAFAAAAICLFFGIPWAGNAILLASGFSTLVYLLCWNGKMQRLDDQGGIGVLINIAILLVDRLLL